MLKTPNKTAILRKTNPQIVTDETDEESIYADYLLANGVIVPPCKVGDYIWFIQNKRLVYVVVENILKNHSGLFAFVFELDDGDIVDEWSIPLCDFGKTVFLTKEEAEVKLKELNNNAIQN